MCQVVPPEFDFSAPRKSDVVVLQKSHTALIKFNGREDQGYQNFQRYLEVLLARHMAHFKTKWGGYNRANNSLAGKVHAVRFLSYNILTGSVSGLISYTRTDFAIESWIPEGTSMAVRLHLLEELEIRESHR